VLGALVAGMEGVDLRADVPGFSFDNFIRNQRLFGGKEAPLKVRRVGGGLRGMLRENSLRQCTPC
jgi:hypothetical protein